MREGKYVEELYKRVCEVPDEKGFSTDEFVDLANSVASDHPLWYERFHIRSLCVRGWRWATGKACGAISKRRDDLSENGAGGGGCGDG